MFTVLIEEICEQFSVIVCLTVKCCLQRDIIQERRLWFSLQVRETLHGIRNMSKWTESENLGHFAKSAFKLPKVFFNELERKTSDF
jgi:hypothetical protein